MAKIAELIEAKAARNEVFISYEYFPPRSEQGVANLKARFDRMRDFAKPLFCDITWGAGGSTSSLTLELTLEMKRVGLEPNMHLTCTNVAKADVVHALETCRKAGVRNIVALRGDPPMGAVKWEASDASFTCALDLVKFIRAEHGDYFNVSVAGYPEGHPDAIAPTDRALEALSPGERARCRIGDAGEVLVCDDAAFDAELAYLKAKVDAGADVIITQMFFDVATYAAFVDAARARGITVPIVPGIMVLQSAAGFKKMTGFCKTRVPDDVKRGVDAVAGDDAALKAFGIDLGVDMCRRLQAVGAPGLHFYTLNLEKSTLAIIDKLGLADAAAAADDARAPKTNGATPNGARASSALPSLTTVAAVAALVAAVFFTVRSHARS